MRLLSGLFLIAGLVFAPMAGAQVFKCMDADGKTVYSQVPCTKADNKEKVIKLMTEPISDTPVYGNGSGPTGSAATANAPSATSAGNAKGSSASGNGLPMPAYGLMRKAASSPTTTPSKQQLIAQCEANHGARCSSAAEINYRRQEQRTPTAEEQAVIQAAIRGRREREEEQRERAFFRR